MRLLFIVMCSVLAFSSCEKKDCSIPCKESGRCKAGISYCDYSKNQDDCLKSEVCKKEGKCSVGIKRCELKSDSDCQMSMLCIEQGKCTYHEAGLCIVGSDRDCLMSNECKVRGKCDKTRPSKKSFFDDRPHPRYNYCKAGRGEDCVRSQNCRDKGLCTHDFHGGICVKSCADYYTEYTYCQNQGRCTPAIDYEKGTYECVAETPLTECRTRSACKEYGRCTLVGGECKATNDSDCRQSTLCKKYGQCIYNKSRDECRSSGDSDCRQSTECKTHGECTESLGICVAGSLEECRESTRCREEGKCTLFMSTCQ